MRTEEAVTAFVASGLARGWKPKTEQWYGYALRQLVAVQRELPVRPEPVEALLAGMRRRDLADATVHDVWAALRIFYRWAAARLGVVNVMGAIGAPIVRECEMRTLSSGEVERLLWVTHRRPRDHALVMLMLDTGLRLGEVAGLGWADLDDDDGGRCTLTVSGKTGERRVPVSPRARAALECLRGQHRLWVGVQGALTKWGVQQVVQRAFQRAGMARGGPHVLRHTFGKLYIMAGGDVFSLQRVMGHRRIETTRKYVNLDIRDVQAQHALYSPIANVIEGRQLRLMEGGDGEYDRSEWA